ncbi:MAG TPA: 3-(cis-5,6-dihydroxycyclohexa-1,3-dien-1-yl)propanoate dehydrogenase [Pseudomonadales bacterium]|nr:3-(cis-5,6-dihydroxycyclohexa-1,3-dien-1-yl)propanoate dehydrogenase [Pseudomonadales bacterium]
MRLDGVSAIITGGASGLGRAVAERFIAEGARVVVLDRSEARVAELTAQHRSRLVGVVGDVRDLTAHRRAVDRAVAEFGHLDVLVANAGIWDYGCSLADLPDDRIDAAFDELIGINVKGYLLAAKAAQRALVASRGTMIFTVSNAGFYPDGGGPLYTASKHAVVGLVRQLAFECAPYVRVNGVAPGAISSDLRGPSSLDMANRSIGDVLKPEMMLGKMPIDRLPTPEDYAAAFVFLAAAKESGQATGSIINIDGGFAARGVARARGGDRLGEDETIR